MLRRTVVALLPLLMAAQPVPPPPLAEARGDVDGDRRVDRVFVERDGTVVVEDGDGRERARVPMPARGAIAHAEAHIVAVEGHTIVHARLDLGHDRAAEIVLGDGGKERIVVASMGTTRDGDMATRLVVDDVGIVQYQTAPGFSRCDGHEMLFPERWDFKDKRFHAVTDDVPAGAKLRASPNAPSGLGGPPLGMFRFTAASVDASGEARADRLGAPRELEDGKADTLWHAGFGAGAKGAWVTARTEAGARKVRAIEIVPGKDAPKSVALILGPLPEQQFTVELGAGVQWVSLPDRAATTCVSVAVLEPGARDNTLAEVRLYTDADGPAGLDRLVSDVAEMRANADGAAHLLAERGVEAARVVGAALPTTEGLGRRRLLQVLATIGSEESAPALGKALETAEPADRALIVGALGKMGAAGAKEASRVYGDESQTAEARADAAIVLGQVGVPDAATVLVDGAGNGEPVVREATMQSLARLYATTYAQIEAALIKTSSAIDRCGQDCSDAATNRRIETRAGDLARAIGMAARHGGTRPEAAVAIDAAWASTPKDSFALRLRLVRAMGDLGDPKLASTLAQAVRDPTAEVRAAAVTAAARVPGGAATVRAGAGDADAGVRKAAMTALSGKPEAAELGVHALGGDPWPMVRRTAADALALACKSHREVYAPLERAVAGADKTMAGADPAEDVRRAALAAIDRCPDVPLPTFTSVLKEKRQPISVRELAAAIVAKAGSAEAAAALAATIDDTLGDPAADERTVGLAVACTRGLVRTHDTSRPVLEALGEAANEPLSPAVRAAAMETIGKLCPTGAAPALQKGARDADGSVQRAARAALERCHR